MLVQLPIDDQIENTHVANADEPVTSAVLHRSLRHSPLKVVGGSGHYLELSNGQRILDATGGAAVACLGHSNERVKKAMAKQLDEIAYCHSLFFSTSAAEELAKELISSTHGHMSKAFIVSSGSEAMEAALKLARQYFVELSPSQPSRTKFIARKGAYHGNTLAALSMSSILSRRAVFEPMLINAGRVSACNTYRGRGEGESPEAYVARLAQELDDEFLRLGPETVCAFIAEPVVGAALGCVPSIAGYFQAMKAVCAKHGALLIFDEVMSGMGRTGTLHAWEQEGVVPDIQTIGKGLGGGYAPVAGLLINSRIVNALDKGTGAFSHGQTYQGHPLACATALEVQRIIREEDLMENVRAMGQLLGRLLREKLSGHLNVGDIRGRGLFWGIEFVRDKESKRPFDVKLGVAMSLHEKGMEPEFGISLYPGIGSFDGTSGDHLLLAPAYTVTAQEIENIVDLTGKVIESYFKSMKVGAM